MKNKRVVLALTADPLTDTHLCAIEQLSTKFHTLLVAVGNNQNKKQSLSLEKRTSKVRDLTSKIENIEIKSFNGELANFSEIIQADVVIFDHLDFPSLQKPNLLDLINNQNQGSDLIYNYINSIKIKHQHIEKQKIHKILQQKQQQHYNRKTKARSIY